MRLDQRVEALYEWAIELVELAPKRSWHAPVSLGACVQHLVLDGPKGHLRTRTARRIHRQASVQHDVANHLSWLCCVAAESDEQELRGLEETEPALELRFVEAMVKVRRAIAEWRRQ